MRTGPARLVYSDPTYSARWVRRLAANRAKLHRKGTDALREIDAVAQGRAAHRVTGSERDGDLMHLAELRADAMRSQLETVATLAALNAIIEPLNARPFQLTRPMFNELVTGKPEAEVIAGMLRRARCADWWLRQLRRAAARKHESDAIRAGAVGVRSAAYCTDFAVRRRARSVAAAQAMLAASVIENEDGEQVTLKACFDASVSHKPIRRGELMTRIRGCEEWADERGFVGVFFTLTAPSRFHSQGGANVKFEGATPRDAQAWLCDQWARARAALVRAGVNVYGFRVAEPHKDGCPHWHALLWAESNAAAAALCMIVRRYWLQWDENEKGAREHRCKAVRMESGNASGYIAKYIAKNIDDVGTVGIEGHRDEWESDASAQGDMFGGTAARVDAWASTWGIRQFQAIGQPPVTVWRELRRIDRAEHEADAPMRIQFALDGAHRVGDERACWHTFLKAQGGVNQGRNYLLRVAMLKTEHEGRYETIEKAKPLGVYEAGKPEALVPSVRKTWKPRGATTPSKVGVRAAGKTTHKRSATGLRSPWTRFNNCTGAPAQKPFRDIVRELLERNAPTMPPPKTGPGGRYQPLKEPPPCSHPGNP